MTHETCYYSTRFRLCPFKHVRTRRWLSAASDYASLDEYDAWIGQPERERGRANDFEQDWAFHVHPGWVAVVTKAWRRRQQAASARAFGSALCGSASA
jgi:hypothetical protein